MRFAIITAAMTAVFVCAESSFAQRGRGPNPNKYGWTFDYEGAIRTAKKTGKPIMLVLRCNP